MDNDDEEPKLWVTVLLLVLGALVLVALVGLALWYAERSDTTEPVVAPDKSWGIVGDSPVHKRKL
ncbi:MAG: hypothetical protein Q8R67_20560 [Rhodoferax sp.]|nr:hypothetical protein [Rhodoferax sp.]MDP3654071.1 hypothetical protein [Rhodoferax sp.]